MRRLITAFLAAATLAGPVAAQDRPDRDWRGARPDAAPEDRGPRPDAGAAQNRPPQPRDDRQGAPDRGAAPDRMAGPPDRRGPDPQRDDRFAQRPDPRFAPGEPGPRPDTGRYDDRGGRNDDGRRYGDRRYDDRGPDDRRYDDRRYDDPRRDDPRFGDGRAGNRPIDPRRFGQQAGRGGNPGWDRRWREDRRYDWQNRRAYAPARYRAGRYVAPRGWGQGYRRWNVGVRLQPIFFGRDYWLDDAGYFGLPPAYGAYRWVRYYDDMLLVDLNTGIVADAVPGFFY